MWNRHTGVYGILSSNRNWFYDQIMGSMEFHDEVNSNIIKFNQMINTEVGRSIEVQQSVILIKINPKENMMRRDIFLPAVFN